MKTKINIDFINALIISMYTLLLFLNVVKDSMYDMLVFLVLLIVFNIYDMVIKYRNNIKILTNGNRLFNIGLYIIMLFGYNFYDFKIAMLLISIYFVGYYILILIFKKNQTYKSRK